MAEEWIAFNDGDGLVDFARADFYRVCKEFQNVDRNV